MRTVPSKLQVFEMQMHMRRLRTGAQTEKTEQKQEPGKV